MATPGLEEHVRRSSLDYLQCFRERPEVLVHEPVILLDLIRSEVRSISTAPFVIQIPSTARSAVIVGQGCPIGQIKVRSACCRLPSSISVHTSWYLLLVHSMRVYLVGKDHE